MTTSSICTPSRYPRLGGAPELDPDTASQVTLPPALRAIGSRIFEQHGNPESGRDRAALALGGCVYVGRSVVRICPVDHVARGADDPWTRQSERDPSARHRRGSASRMRRWEDRVTE